MPEEDKDRNAEKDAGCLAVLGACITGCFAAVGRCLGKSWFATSAKGRIVTETLLTASLIAQVCLTIPAWRDLYWGWILTVISIIALVVGILYAWQPQMCPIKGDKPKIGPLRLQTPLFALFCLSHAAFLGMWVYCIYLYTVPLAQGFTSNPDASTPAYCDKVIGANPSVLVPTTNVQYCNNVISAWQRDVGIVAASIVPMLLSVMFGSCLMAGFKIWIAREFVKAQEAFNAKVLADQEAQKVQLVQLQQSNQQLQQQVNQMQQAYPVNQQPIGQPVGQPLAVVQGMPAPAGVQPGQVVYAPGTIPGQQIQYVAVQGAPPGTLQGATVQGSTIPSNASTTVAAVNPTVVPPPGIPPPGSPGWGQPPPPPPPATQ